MRFLVVFFALTILPGTTQAGNPQIDKGRRLFETVGCYQCHGYRGQGGSAGARLAPAPLPYEAFAQFVRETTGAMPAYSVDILSGNDLDAIYEFLKSVPNGAPPERIPLLSNLR